MFVVFKKENVMKEKEIKPKKIIVDDVLLHKIEENPLAKTMAQIDIKQIQGQFVDVFNRIIYPAEITIQDKKIKTITRIENASAQFILPGFVDAHIHIESSMLVPSEFAKIAVLHGTVATVSDPHEIANVCGIEGVDYMLENAKLSPFKFNFGAPSCVPATSFETSGAVINSQQIAQLLSRKEIKYLSEMMNFPGVLMKDSEVMAKLEAAKNAGKPIDGHAPGLRNGDAKQYADAGISTDHECVEIEEALDKIKFGMKILIREGSAAKNFEALVDLFQQHPKEIMLCSDDKHPDELLKGHINQLVSRAIAKGLDLFDVLWAACVLPVIHYNLEVGLLRIDDPADFIVVENLTGFPVIQTFINGQMLAQNGNCLIESVPIVPINNFNAQLRKVEDFKISVKETDQELKVKVIEALDGQLITNAITKTLKIQDNELQSDVKQDILKIGVVNRYLTNEPVALGFVYNFGLKEGAIASTVAHDSHNIVFVGVDDISILNAVNALIKEKGGISVSTNNQTSVMPLPIAGLMSNNDAYATAKEYQSLDAAAKQLGSKLSAPFMTLSFMALPVIPHLKITDKGLFDIDVFGFTDLKI